MKSFITYILLFFNTLISAQNDHISPEKSVLHIEYSKIEGAFLIKLENKPTFKLGGKKAEFKTISMAELKTKILETQ